jgi:hypothetical protein
MSQKTFEEAREIRRLLDTEWGRTHLYFGVVKSNDKRNETKNQKEENDHATN